MPNTTVEALGTPLSRTGCGTQQLCASEPSTCDPSSTNCFFLAAKQTSGQNFEFGLAGQSTGYVAATLSTDATLGGNDTTYVCANNNGTVKFFGAFLDNGRLTTTELPVNNVKGSVNGSTIQCTFAATVPNSTARTTNFVLGISTGPFDATSNTLGNTTTRLQSTAVNLANASATVTNTLNANPTAAPNTTSHAITLQQSLMQALLITGAMLGLVMH
nr:putative ferric-chelate reductase 1 isoform X2 [Epinephelus lanceolatus]